MLYSDAVGTANSGKIFASVKLNFDDFAEAPVFTVTNTFHPTEPSSMKFVSHLTQTDLFIQACDTQSFVNAFHAIPESSKLSSEASYPFLWIDRSESFIVDRLAPGDFTVSPCGDLV